MSWDGYDPPISPRTGPRQADLGACEVDYSKEAHLLATIIRNTAAWRQGKLSEKEMDLVLELHNDEKMTATQKMVFWLRDMRDKCL